MRAKLLFLTILSLLLEPTGGARAAAVQVLSGGSCPAPAQCVTAVSDLVVPGLPSPYDVTFIHGAGLYAALPVGPDFDAAGAFVAATALTSALNVASASHGGVGFDFLAGDGTAATGALIPYVSDGANSYLLSTFLASSQPPAWTLDTFANYGTGIDGVYAHFSTEVDEPENIGLLGLALLVVHCMRKRRTP